MLKLFIVVSFSLVLVNGQDNQVCFPVPSALAGPPGPPGPIGPPGEVQECKCNDTETRQLIEEQQGGMSVLKQVFTDRFLLLF